VIPSHQDSGDFFLKKNKIPAIPTVSGGMERPKKKERRGG
jgi:hypothetical protein